MKKILILDDDLITQKILFHTLSSEYDIIQCQNIKEVETTLQETNSISLFLLDRTLPDGDGLNICKLIRSNPAYNMVPIIFLSGCDTENDKVFSLFSGANDYVTKPFSLLELKARISAHLRQQSRKIYTQDYEIDLDSQSIKSKTDSNEQISLTPTEFKLLVFLLQNKDRIFHRNDLLNRIWGNQLNVTDRVVDAHISHLRKKLSNSSLSFKCMRGEGYTVKDAS